MSFLGTGETRCNPVKYLHTEQQQKYDKKPHEKNDEQKAKQLIREALSPVSPHQTNGYGAEQANALLWSHINTINITHTICLQQSGLGQALRAHF